MKNLLFFLSGLVLAICPYILISLIAYLLFRLLSPDVTFIKFSIIVIVALVLYALWNKLTGRKRSKDEMIKMEIVLGSQFINKAIVNQLIAEIEMSVDEIKNTVSQNKFRIKKEVIQCEFNEIDESIESFYNFREVSENSKYSLQNLFDILEDYNYCYLDNEYDLKIRLFNNVTPDYVLNGKVSITFEIVILLIDYLQTKPGNWQSHQIEMEVSKKFGMLIIELIREKSMNVMFVSKPDDENVDWKYRKAKVLAENCNFNLKMRNKENNECCSLLFYN